MKNEENLEIIATGGAGFIGSNFLSHMIEKYPSYNFTNVDKLSYSGDRRNVSGLELKKNYKFVLSDINDTELMSRIIKPGSVIINFAAESHVDNSINEPHLFAKTNVLGTLSLLTAAREIGAKLFVQISTDEVYGSLDFEAPSKKEDASFRPSSPYSASKAAAEMFCFSSVRTYGQPVIITRSSNNFGPFQFPEKVIPLFVTNLAEGRKVPVYGTGHNVRDWIHVQDNCEAIDFLIHNGKPGEVYNIGGGNEIANIELTQRILKVMGKDLSYIEHVKDRPGHDLRYSIDCSKLHSLGWKPRYEFDTALAATVQWYRTNKDWWEPHKKVKGKRTS